MTKPHFVVIEADTGPEIATRQICFSKDGNRIVGMASMRTDPTRVRLVEWDASTGESLASSHEPFVADGRGMLLSPTGERIAILSERQVDLIDGGSLRRLQSFKLPGELFLGTMVWSSDGRHLAVNAPKLAVWDVTEGKQLGEFDDDMNPVGFSSNDPVDVLVGGDTGAWKLSVISGKRSNVTKMPKGQGYCWSHGYTPSRQILLSISERGRLLQTDLRTGEKTVGDGLRSSCSHRFAFSPDGDRVAIWGSSGTLLVWDLAAKRPLFKWSREHFHQIDCACFSRDGQRLAVSLEGNVYVLDFRKGACARELKVSCLESGLFRCMEMNGAEQQMDQAGFDTPLNPLPVKCVTCGLPDLDFIGDPYLVGRGIDKPGDMSMAAGGNFFVRESVAQVLEKVAPGQCSFVPTRHAKTGALTQWLLAIPKQLQTTATPPATRERCPSCNEPWCFHYYSEAQTGKEFSNPISTHDVFKARQWGCHRVPFKGWGKPRPQLFPRQLYFSVRLEQLLRKLKFRGLTRSGVCKAKPDAADQLWVKEQLRRIQVSGESGSGGSAKLETSLSWFAEYIEKLQRKTPVNFDFDALEGRENCRLPATYREFAVRAGRKGFKNFRGEEGLTVTLLPPGKLDFATFANMDREADQPSRAVVFGSLNNGDALCFDLSKTDPEIPVYHYDHESDAFELFAANFPACVRRLVEGS